jgi:hypothetical protein
MFSIQEKSFVRVEVNSANAERRRGGIHWPTSLQNCRAELVKMRRF